ncbi:PiggyBac transposable element-derived protein 4 [Plakobranchus ocellatus]|uniref:PiggyBac transposable element-derived protein 4 n=1 Tax=Plakobranchus ocellatus TaxID=259542 RepID=A0AAV3YBG7_9GAST|nr:PiggyBac transposable element-derived protein 4 [Plakobranchus ocellatus]
MNSCGSILVDVFKDGDIRFIDVDFSHRHNNSENKQNVKQSWTKNSNRETSATTSVSSSVPTLPLCPNAEAQEAIYEEEAPGTTYLEMLPRNTAIAVENLRTYLHNHASDIFLRNQFESKKVKNAFLLSTMHSVPERCETSGKSDIVLTYYKSEGGVDTMDQMDYAFTEKTKRWLLVVLFNIIDFSTNGTRVIRQARLSEHKLPHDDN